MTVVSMKTAIVLPILFSTIRNAKSTIASRLPVKPVSKKQSPTGKKPIGRNRDRNCQPEQRQPGIDL